MNVREGSLKKTLKAAEDETGSCSQMKTRVAVCVDAPPVGEHKAQGSTQKWARLVAAVCLGGS